VDDLVVLSKLGRQEIAYLAKLWHARVRPCPVQELRKFFPDPLANLIDQYSQVDRARARLHVELIAFVEDNAMPDLVELE
jgi:hypothetical protein